MSTALHWDAIPSSGASKPKANPSNIELRPRANQREIGNSIKIIFETDQSIIKYPERHEYQKCKQKQHALTAANSGPNQNNVEGK